MRTADAKYSHKAFSTQCNDASLLIPPRLAGGRLTASRMVRSRTVDTLGAITKWAT